MWKLLTLLALGQLPLIPGLSLREQSAFLLLEPAVQKTLSLTPPQVAGLETAGQERDRRTGALVEAHKPVSDAAFVENDRRFAAEAVAGLDDAQRRRLFVQAVRERGVAAMADAEVAKEVGLEGADLARVVKAAGEMDARDARIVDELVAAVEKIPAPKTRTAAYDRRIEALTKANAVKEKARAAERKREEAALLASLPQPVRLAWKRLVG